MNTIKTRKKLETGLFIILNKCAILLTFKYLTVYKVSSALYYFIANKIDNREFACFQHPAEFRSINIVIPFPSFIFFSKMDEIAEVLVDKN